MEPCNRWCPTRCRSTGRRRRIGSSASEGTSGRWCSRREPAHLDAPFLESLILAGVALAGPLCAVGLVVVEFDDEIAPSQVDLVAVDLLVHLRRAQSPQ